MAQAVAHRGHPGDALVERIGPGRQACAVDAGATVSAEHRADLFQRESRRPAQRDQGQALHHLLGKHAAQPAPAHRADQALFLVIPQGRWGQPRPSRHLADIQFLHPLDLKPT